MRRKLEVGLYIGLGVMLGLGIATYRNFIPGGVSLAQVQQLMVKTCARYLFLQEDDDRDKAAPKPVASSEIIPDNASFSVQISM